MLMIISIKNIAIGVFSLFLGNFVLDEIVTHEPKVKLM